MKIQFYKILSLLAALSMLCACTEDEIYPVANFTTTGFVPGFKWKLDASSSLSINAGTLMYRWDYDEDQSQFDTSWQTDPIFTPIRDSKSVEIKVVTLQVKDTDGLITEISKEVQRSGFLYSFRHDTIRTEHLKIPFNSYSWIEDSNVTVTAWMLQNAFQTSSEFCTNLSDSLQSGSYLSWQGANTLRFPNSNFSLASKSHWEALIKLFFGDKLAGFNLQANSDYSIRLGLHGYINNNQLLENNQICYYWTATEIDENNAWAVKIEKNSDRVEFISLPKNQRCKVRLINTIQY